LCAFYDGLEIRSEAIRNLGGCGSARQLCKTAVHLNERRRAFGFHGVCSLHPGVLEVFTIMSYAVPPWSHAVLSPLKGGTVVMHGSCACKEFVSECWIGALLCYFELAVPYVNV